MPLAEVPALVFTEAMRDVDLFVGVASIASDPTWTDRGTNRGFDRYWHDHSFGELPESAQTRRAALERLAPKTKIADRCEVTDRFLVVRGNVRTYKIHIGSANILMEPGRQLPVHRPGSAPRPRAQRVPALRGGRRAPQRHHVEGLPPRGRRGHHRPVNPQPVTHAIARLKYIICRA